MKFSTFFKDEIDSLIRSRGQMYYQWKYVRKVTKNTSGIEASVSGSNSKMYSVMIRIQSLDVQVCCNCYHFSSGKLCKHIWAAILAAEKNGYEPERLTFDSSLVRMKKSKKGVYVVDEEYDDGWEEDYDEDGIGSPAWEKVRKNLAVKTRKKLTLGSRELMTGAMVKNGQNQEYQQIPWKVLFIGSTQPRPQLRLENYQVVYFLKESDYYNRNVVQLSFKKRKIKPDGQLGKLTKIDNPNRLALLIPDPTDREILSIAEDYSSTAYLHGAQIDIFLPRILATGRCYWGSDTKAEKPLVLNPQPWEFGCKLSGMPKGYALTGFLYRGTERREISEDDFIIGKSFLLADNEVSAIDGGDGWIETLRSGPIFIPKKEIHAFIVALKTSPVPPPVEIPEDLQIPVHEVQPAAVFRILDEKRGSLWIANVLVKYGDEIVGLEENSVGLYSPQNNSIIKIDHTFHHRCKNNLISLGMQPITSWEPQKCLFSFPEKNFLHIANALIEDGWIVEGKKGVFRKPGSFSINVTSGIDWFDLDIECEYDDEGVMAPYLLSALKKGERFIRLDNGELGLIPEEWFKRYGTILGMATAHNGALRFKRSQALLIELLLRNNEENTCDRAFEDLRKRLADFDGIQPDDAPSTFNGVLRQYQKEGLGWLNFLKEFAFGGCLADDMGLGKTIQVLALLEKKRLSKKPPRGRRKTRRAASSSGVSLVVAPRSLIYNWMAEAARFVPKLKVLDYSGNDRKDANIDFYEYDMALVTYGVLLRDIEMLCAIEFDYIVLDEAQVIKNSSSLTAKACRALKGKQRIGLSGTPVENHLGDLWSIFEFLNPGILGNMASFKKGFLSKKKIDEESCEMLRRAMKPFILRRTKEQVAADLPPRTEEIILCEMEKKQKQIYNGLKAHYRTELLARIQKDGLAKSKIHVLEALLRLRQTACHPGLVGSEYMKVESVKTTTLLEQVAAIQSEGHKCLVFSQFTSMLAILKSRFEARKMACAYLDGKTRNRKEVIEKFSESEDIGIFLISLKAGGVGLNLTAAEYVFIYDPWWNPAVEKQAIDRTHRIGQSKPVFAYKLICKDTVEEKILNLQKSKLKLADAIITSDESILQSITPEDLAILLE